MFPKMIKQMEKLEPRKIQFYSPCNITFITFAEILQITVVFMNETGEKKNACQKTEKLG